MIIFATEKAEEPIRAFQVFGERCSGTNWVSALIAENFPNLDDCVTRADRDLALEWQFGWKHGAPMMPFLPPWALFVVVTRHPETWARSLHRTPWHAAPQLRDLPFTAFLRHEWQSVVDNSGFGAKHGGRDWGTELNWDRHPITGARFSHLADLRRVKLALHLSFENRGGVALAATYESIANDPEKFIETLAMTYGLSRRGSFRSVETYKGRNGQPQHITFEPLDASDRDWLWSHLDAPTEARLGYAPLPCA